MQSLLIFMKSVHNRHRKTTGLFFKVSLKIMWHCNVFSWIFMYNLSVELFIDDSHSIQLFLPRFGTGTEVTTCYQQNLMIYCYITGIPVIIIVSTKSLCSKLSQLNVSSSMIFDNFALLEKNRARSVARIQCFMLPRT